MMTGADVTRALDRVGVSRRAFTKLASLAGGVALVTHLVPELADAEDLVLQQASAWKKDPGPFIEHATNLETRLENLTGIITPIEQFFVRNHAPTPEIDVASWRLRVGGDGVGSELELSYADLLDLPSRSVIAYLECAGNWRSFSRELTGRRASGGQWGTGGVGCAEWTGTPLHHVLDLAGLRADAVDVNLVGLDEGAYARPMPLEKALDPDTLLVWAMNGHVLPADHGFPVRAVLPGWVAGSSIKWIGSIDVSTSKIWGRNNTTSYVLIGDDWPAERYAPADGAPITTQSIKSALALPRPATLSAGRRRLRGFAYSPHAPIERVDWSDDEGETWRPATVLDPVLRHAWARFELEWESAAGSRVLMVRATDEAGNTQPMTKAWNQKGYLINAVLPHPIEVTPAPD